MRQAACASRGALPRGRAFVFTACAVGVPVCTHGLRNGQRIVFAPALPLASVPPSRHLDEGAQAWRRRSGGVPYTIPFGIQRPSACPEPFGACSDQRSCRARWCAMQDRLCHLRVEPRTVDPGLRARR